MMDWWAVQSVPHTHPLMATGIGSFLPLPRPRGISQCWPTEKNCWMLCVDAVMLFEFDSELSGSEESKLKPVVLSWRDIFNPILSALIYS